MTAPVSLPDWLWDLFCLGTAAVDEERIFTGSTRFRSFPPFWGTCPQAVFNVFA